MESIKFVSPSWLAAARARAEVKLRQIRTERPEVFGNATLVPTHAPVASYVPALTDRRMGDAQISHTANGGVPGPLYAWREPVIT